MSAHQPFSFKSDHTPLLAGAKELSRHEFVHRARLWAASLRRSGVKPGSVVVGDGLSREQLVEVWGGCLYYGAIFAPLARHWQPLQRETFLKQLGAFFLISRDDAPLEDRASDRDSYSWQADRPCLLLLTSGTQAGPKWVALSWQNLSASCKATRDFYHLSPGDRWLQLLPMEHIGGLMIFLRMWLCQGVCVLPLVPKNWLEALERQSFDYVSLVPRQLEKALAVPKAVENLAASKAILVGGSAPPPPLAEALKSLPLRVSLTYGSTETASQIIAHLPKLGGFALGTPLPKVQVRENEGRLEVKGDMVFLGYWNQTLLRKPQDWFPTPDGGRILAGGEVVIEGRLDDVMVVTGENIHPHTIETPFWRHIPDAEVLAFARSKARAEPLLAIFLAAKPDQDSLRKALAELPTHWQPREILWGKKVPRVGPLGKCSRSFLQKEWSHLGLKSLASKTKQGEMKFALD